MTSSGKPKVQALLDQARTVTPEQLRELWEAFIETGDPELRARIAEQYVPLVRYVQQRVASSAPAWVDRGDHLSYGYMGLMDAINKFRLDSGATFESYATTRIRGAILDGLRKEDPLTRRERRDVKALYVEFEKFWDTNGRAPSHQELADQSGLPYDQVWMTMAVAKTLPVSLQAHEDDGEEGPGRSMLDDMVDVVSDDPELQSEIEAMGEQVAHIVADMDRREQQFIMLHYGDGLSLRDVGSHMGISDARAGQIRLEIVEAVRRSSL